MSEPFQGFLASIAAALFFVSTLAAVKSIVWRSGYSGDQDNACGAAEGDQIHFRMTDGKGASAEKPS